MWPRNINENRPSRAVRGRLDPELRNLGYAKAGSDRLIRKRVHLPDCARLAIDKLRSPLEQQSIRVDLECDAQDVRADEAILLRILVNLLGNSVKYMHRETRGLITITMSRAWEEIRTVIADNGPGIDPSLLEDVFLPFKRANVDERGTGLGLSIVKKYTESFGGRIRLISDGASGTSVVLMLPAASSASLDLPESDAA